MRLAGLVLLLGLGLLLGSALRAPAEAREIDSTFAFREAFLPPGAPSVAMHYDETAMLWNPAGMALSPTYYLGYAWKGTYLRDDRQVRTYFILTKARGFGLGFMRDDYSEGTKTTTIFSLAPRVTNNLAIGFTGKWKGGFNFDCGAMFRKPNVFAVGVVGRNLRERENVRRYIESGIAVTAIRRKLVLFFDVVNEESPWRDALAYGGGFTARLEYGINTTISYFTDGEDNAIYRASLNFLWGVNSIEGEYSTSSDHWRTLSGRIANRSE
jgi:hypothetical protein